MPFDTSIGGSQAHLGGSVDAFDVAFTRAVPGIADPEMASLTYEPCEPSGERPEVSVAFAPVAYLVTVEPCQPAPIGSLEAAHAQGASRFMPADAELVENTVSGEGEPMAVYRSASLANLVAGYPLIFVTDCERNPVPPGTFVLVAAEVSFTLAVGLCP